METIIPVIAISIIILVTVLGVSKIANNPTTSSYKKKNNGNLSNKDDSSSVIKPQTTQPEIVKEDIIIWGSWDGIKASALSMVISKFNHTNRRINLIYIYKQNLPLALSSINIKHSMPDIVLFDRSNSKLFYEKKYFVSLDEFIMAENIMLQEFVKPALDELTHNNAIYGLPITINTKALFYNKDIFAKNGIMEPPSNWNQLSTIAKKLTEYSLEDGTLIRAGISLNDEYIFSTVLRSFGGSMYTSDGAPNFNSEAGLKILESWYKLIYEDKVYKVGFTDVDNIAHFAESKMAMKFGDVRTMVALDKKYPNFNYGIAPIPSWDDNKVKPIITGYGIGLYRDSKNKDFAFDVIKYLSTNQNVATRLFNVAGVIPANTKTHDTSTFINNNYKSIIDFMKEGIHAEHIVEYNRIEKEALVLNIQLVLSDIVKPKEALEDAERRAIAILKGEA